MQEAHKLQSLDQLISIKVPKAVIIIPYRSPAGYGTFDGITGQEGLAGDSIDRQLALAERRSAAEAEWLPSQRETGYFWIDLTNPGIRTYMRGIVMERLAVYGVAGINLDFMRFLHAEAAEIASAVDTLQSWLEERQSAGAVHPAAARQAAVALAEAGSLLLYSQTKQVNERQRRRSLRR